MKSFLLVISVAVAIFLIAPSNSSAQTIQADGMRTANYFLRAGTDLRPEMYNDLASYNLLVLPMEAAVYNRDFFTYARSVNPTIIILPYVPARSININNIDDGARIRKRMKDGIRDSWYLRDSRGAIVSAWPGTMPINVTTEWSEYLPQFIKDTVLSTGVWDGIFYDEWQDDMSYLNHGDVDLDGNGIPEPRDESARRWQSGNVSLLQNTRALLGNDIIIITNGSSLPVYQPYVNGRMFENFPTPWEGRGTWYDSIKSYLWLQSQVLQPHVIVINGTTRNAGTKDSYQTVRYGLTSTLLGDGYFGFDFGDTDHGQIWRYDEFGVRLGLAKNPPQRIDDSVSDIAPGVWKRDYEKGLVLVNSSGRDTDIILSEDYEKIRGTQDPLINDGSIASSVHLASDDGIVLLRPISEISNASYLNGSFVRMFGKDGSVKRNGFFAYDQSRRGSLLLIHGDIDKDGSDDTISVDHGIIHESFGNGQRLDFIPFPERPGIDVFVHLAHVTADEATSLVVTPLPPQLQLTNAKKKMRQDKASVIRVFSANGKKTHEILPFGRNYSGGLTVSTGDMNGDGIPEYVVGKTEGALPEVRVLRSDGRVLNTFLAYNASFRGGVSVAVADLDGDGFHSIVTAPLTSGSPQVRIFDRTGKIRNPGFFAFTKTLRGGMMVAATDVDGDGKDEILGMTTHVFTTSTLEQ